MKFYEALKFLLTTCGNTKISRKKWPSNKYVMKSTITLGNRSGTSDDNIINIPSIDIIEIFGGNNEYRTTYHANPSDMLAEDWYIINENN